MRLIAEIVKIVRMNDAASPHTRATATIATVVVPVPSMVVAPVPAIPTPVVPAMVAVATVETAAIVVAAAMAETVETTRSPDAFEGHVRSLISIKDQYKALMALSATFSISFGVLEVLDIAVLGFFLTVLSGIGWDVYSSKIEEVGASLRKGSKSTPTP